MNLRHLLSVTMLTLATTVVTTTAFAAGEAPATPAPAAVVPAKTAITKEQAIEMALKAHPGQVTKAYEDTKKGKKTWEVKIKGDDGQKWEMYYEIATGELVAEEAD
jgi:uncharacterized membrane protein YkoI